MPNGYSDRLYAWLFTTIAHFHMKYGVWPQSIRVPDYILHDILVMADESAFNPLWDRLELISDNESLFIAEGPGGKIYKLDLDKDGYAEISYVKKASDWLCGIQISENA